MKSGRKFLLTNLLYLKVFLAFALGIISAEFVNNDWILASLPFILFASFIVTYFLIRVNRSKYLDSLIFCSIFDLMHSFSVVYALKSILLMLLKDLLGFYLSVSELFI